jgi:hypothetical protein
MVVKLLLQLCYTGIQLPCIERVSEIIGLLVGWGLATLIPKVNIHRKLKHTFAIEIL